MTAVVDTPASTSRRARSRSRVRLAFEILVAAVGAGLTVIVVLDGSWLWRVVRVLLVGAVVSRLMAVVHRRSRPAAVAVAALLTGVVATPVGAAIGIPYLSVSGVSLRSLAGLLVAAAGLVLVVLATVMLVRAVGGWKGLLVIPPVLLVAYAAGPTLVVAVAATNVPRRSVGTETPADRGVQYVDATFTTSDGVSLSGWYIPSTNGAAVALLHGASSTRSNVLDHAVVLARHGYGVLLFDARGLGRSGGRAMNLGWYGDYDVAAAVTYLTARRDVDPNRIGAVGMSMGGEEALGAMGADGRLRAVVAEGATNRVAADFSWRTSTFGWRGVLQQGVDRVKYGLTNLLTAAHAPLSLRAAARAAAPRPVLLIAAGKVADESRADEAIRAASPGNVDVWVVPGATHTSGLRTQPAEWEARVTAFLGTALAAR